MKLHPTKSLPDSPLKRTSEKPSTTRKPCLKSSSSQKQFGDLTVRRVSVSQLNPKVLLSPESQSDSRIDVKSKQSIASQACTATNTITELCAELSSKTVSPTSFRKRERELLAKLNDSLNEKLKPLESQSDLKSRLLVYQEMFTVVICLEPVFGALLRRVKAGYDDVFSQLLTSANEHSVCSLTGRIHDLQESLKSQQREKDDLSVCVTKLRRDNQQYMLRISELTAMCKWKDKQLKDVLTGENQCKPSSLSEMVKTLQTEVEILKTRETLLLSAVGAGQRSTHNSRKTFHKKSLSTCTPLSKAMPRLTFFESQHTAGSISPIGKDAEGFMWDGSTIEGQEKLGEETANG